MSKGLGVLSQVLETMTAHTKSLEMVKKKVGGGQKFKAATKANSEGKEPSDAWKGRGPAPPKHIKRKITKKVEFLERVAKSSQVSKKYGVQKTKKAPKQIDLSSLSGNLEIIAQKQLAGLKLLGKAKRRVRISGAKHLKPKSEPEEREASASDDSRRPFGESVGTNAVRRIILEKETSRLQQVVSHPVYKLDPIAAITNHLSRSVPQHEHCSKIGVQKKAMKKERR
jgi:hypothetical protein